MKKQVKGVQKTVKFKELGIEVVARDEAQAKEKVMEYYGIDVDKEIKEFNARQKAAQNGHRTTKDTEVE